MTLTDTPPPPAEGLSMAEIKAELLALATRYRNMPIAPSDYCLSDEIRSIASELFYLAECIDDAD